MDWSVAQSKIIEAVQLALDDGSYDVGWSDRQSRWRSSAGHVRLRVQGLRGRGLGERRYSDTDVEGEAQERVYGPRVLTVEFLVSASAQSLADSAWALADQISTGLRRSDVEAVLAQASLGVGQVEAIQPLGEVTDSHNRVRSVVAFDAHLNTHASYEGAVIGTVEHAEIEGTFEDGQSIGPTLIPEAS